MALKAEILRQMDEILRKCQALSARRKYDDCSDLPKAEVSAVITLMNDTVSRFAPRGSQYMESLTQISKT